MGLSYICIHLADENDDQGDNLYDEQDDNDDQDDHIYND